MKTLRLSVTSGQHWISECAKPARKATRHSGNPSQLGVAGLALIAILYGHPFPAQATDDDSAIVTPGGGRYSGPLVDGKLHGIGRMTWRDGSIYEGGFEQGMFSGKGRMRYPNGEIYEGNFVQGMPSGQGRLTTRQGDVFTGEFRTGEINGQGHLKSVNGTAYEGSFKANLYDGHGKLTTPVSEYTGEFQAGEFSGQGEVRYKDGRKYIGNFAHGQFEGKGRMEYPTGAWYDGDFLAGEFTGQGQASYPGGAKYQGQFRNWKPDGQGVFNDARGNRYEGSFKEGNITGIARFISKDGNNYEGEFKNWMPNGHGELRRANGDIYKGDFAYGEFDGEGTLTYAKPQADGRKEDRGEWSYGRFKKTEDEKKRRTKADVEAALYRQPALLREVLDQVTPRDPNRINMYFLAIAGDGSQEVFRREIEYIHHQFDTAYATRGHSLSLINSRNTVIKSPLATVTSIRQAIDTLTGKMDRDKDILFLYVTSHGSKDGEISLGLPGMELPALTAGELDAMLKQSQVRWKVVLISACYAGSFINRLKDPNTLIITAARDDRTSFGCADENQFTYFGRAFFKEALPLAKSFEDAFARADRLITEWEDQELQQHPSATKDAKKTEHHSLPQMLAPPSIRGHLRRWWAQFPAASPESAALIHAAFSGRVARAKQLEESKEVQDYFNTQMFPAIGQDMADAMRACTGGKQAKAQQFSVVADIMSDGTFSMIDHEPKTIAAVCFADAVAAFHAPPPPLGSRDRLPIVIEMSDRP